MKLPAFAWKKISSRTLIAVLLISLGSVSSAFAVDAVDPLYPTGKRTGFMGDPSRKRGLELGFDLGIKAGIKARESQERADLRAQSDFKNPEKHYRYEYGSRSAFISGFLGGFAGGYRQAYEKGAAVLWQPIQQAAEASLASVAELKGLPPAAPVSAATEATSNFAAKASAKVEEAFLGGKKVKRASRRPDASAKNIDSELHRDAL